MKKLSVKDYIKIDFLKYILVAISSFILDTVLFTIFNWLLKDIFSYEAIIISTILARVISSFYNYFCNSRLVFQKYSRKMMINYFKLVIGQMFVSGILVYFINKLVIDIFVTFIKILVDTMIFIANYFIQKKVIFK